MGGHRVLGEIGAGAGTSVADIVDNLGIEPHGALLLVEKLNGRLERKLLLLRRHPTKRAAALYAMEEVVRGGGGQWDQRGCLL